MPFGRMGRPEDLCRHGRISGQRRIRHIVAQTYNVDGGQWMSDGTWWKDIRHSPQRLAG